MKAKFKAGDRVRVGLPGEAKRIGTIEQVSRPPPSQPAKGSVRRERQYLIRFESDEPLLIREEYLELVDYKAELDLIPSQAKHDPHPASPSPNTISDGGRSWDHLFPFSPPIVDLSYLRP